jgi:hypothetical protein
VKADPDLALLAPLGTHCCPCPRHGWAEYPGAELVSDSSRVRLWWDAGKQDACSGPLMQYQSLRAEGLAPSPHPWADRLVWRWEDGDGNRYHATNRLTLLNVSVWPDANADGETLPAWWGADSMLLAQSPGRVWPVAAASNVLRKVLLAAEVGPGVPGELILRADGPVRVWAEASADGAPLLDPPGGVTVHTFPARFTERGVYVEATAPGDAELAFEFDGREEGGFSGRERPARFRAVAKQTIKAWEIDFVHAEGGDEGEPMAHLPVFTPSDGIGKGEPVYDSPAPDLTIALSPTNAAGIRSAAVTYLGSSFSVAETAPDSLAFTNGAASLTLSGAVPADPNVLEWAGASVTVPALGVTNAVYPCVETSAGSSVFENAVCGLVFSVEAPAAANRAASLRITTETSSRGIALAETSAGTDIFAGGGCTVRMAGTPGQPRLAVTDGLTLSNAAFSVWETAPQSGIYRNYNEPAPTDLPASALAVPDFAPWRLRIRGMTDASVISGVSVTTSVDSVSQIAFTASGGDLLSDQKFILIPDGELEADPPEGYTPLRVDTLQSRWWDEGQRDVGCSLTLAMASAPKVDKAAKSQNGALVLESLELNPLIHGFLSIDTKGRIAAPLKSMGYDTSAANYKATVSYALAHAPAKQVWYSLSHGGTEYGVSESASPFNGLNFLDGTITKDDLIPLEIDYRLVLVDGCNSAQTTADNIETARNSNTFNESVMEFADAFGFNSAYAGWAWWMSPGISQPLMSEFILELKHRDAEGSTSGAFTPSVAYAYASFRQKKLNDEVVSNELKNDVRLLKIYGEQALQNKIDLTGEKK